ncbi:MAG: class I SAM-dependent methyltransferase [Desulfarculus sp.]|jgi:SAM-dependent methyltransferase|nr:MAG: class I SAM-dependent methyltransferase [Desulfarculus sp.]
MNAPEVKVGPSAYDRWRASDLGALTEEIEHRLLWETIGDPRRRLVLDVGCGDGLLARQASRMGARVVGLDPDQAMLAAAVAHGASGLDGPWWVRGRAQHLPIKDACCDLVVAVTVLCFLSASEARKATAEMARVLRPGGRLVLGELSPYSIWAASRRVRGWLGSRLWRRARFHGPAELKGLAQEAGLKAESLQGAVYYPPWWWAARRLATWERALSAVTTLGAAFLILAASKPRRPAVIG